MSVETLVGTPEGRPDPSGFRRPSSFLRLRGPSLYFVPSPSKYIFLLARLFNFYCLRRKDEAIKIDIYIELRT